MAQAKGVLEAALRGDTAKASPVYGDALDVGAAESSQVNGEYVSRGVSKVDREKEKEKEREMYDRRTSDG